MAARRAREVEDREVGRTAELLGGRRTLRRTLRTRLEAHDLLQEGIPARALEHLVGAVTIVRTGDAFQKCFGLSERTYQRRKENLDQLLSPEQSARAWKFAEVLSRAIAVFGSKDEAQHWLERPALGLDQRRPIDLLSTPAGVETVEDHLTRLEYGVYA